MSAFEPFHHYAAFGGRSGRREFWQFVLLQLGVSLALPIMSDLAVLLSDSVDPQILAFAHGTMVATQIWWLVSLMPAVAVTVRRLQHDQERTGLLALLYLIPIIGAMTLLVILAGAGMRGPNRYGPDPVARMHP